MCTVFAYSGKAISIPQIRRILEKTERRGPDAERIISPEKNLFLAFQRLSIMGLDERGMQPFEYKGMYSITNGEIYGFRDIRRQLENDGYAFSSDSDCETILYLWDKYREKMFSKLDAEFAAVIYDKEDGLIAARDPIGIRPLFFRLMRWRGDVLQWPMTGRTMLVRWMLISLNQASKLQFRLF